MDKVFKYFNDFFKGLVGLIMGLLALSIVADFLFGPGSIEGINVIENITGVISGFAGDGVIGLIGLLIVWNLISSK
ncbi:MAG: hypothetical protein HN702_04040 [Flavobacteriales bacterium]|jgi:hypothetical protein|nr:hypothetical protein [Flavobacteriales bacterium]MBT7726546.1 hypothetical protein [Flavobacteriales bacterium]